MSESATPGAVPPEWRPTYLYNALCCGCHQVRPFVWLRDGGIWLGLPRCERCLRQWRAWVMPDPRKPSDFGRALQALRKRHAGPPKRLRACPHCGKRCGAREMRKHLPICKER